MRNIAKIPPPTPDGREGRLFPPEQSWKTSTLLNEVTVDRNKILHEGCALARARVEGSSFLCVILVRTRPYKAWLARC